MQPMEIRIKGHLDEGWVDWLDGFTITHVERNETLLSGFVADQAALYGLIAKLRDLGVQLIAIQLGERASKND